MYWSDGSKNGGLVIQRCYPICRHWCKNICLCKPMYYWGVQMSPCLMTHEMYPLPLFKPFLSKQYIHPSSSLVPSIPCSPTTMDKHKRVCHLLGLTWAKLISKVLRARAIIWRNGHHSPILNGAKCTIYLPTRGSSKSYKWWGTYIKPTRDGKPYLCLISIRLSNVITLAIFSIWCLSLVMLVGSPWW